MKNFSQFEVVDPAIVRSIEEMKWAMSGLRVGMTVAMWGSEGEALKFDLARNYNSNVWGAYIYGTNEFVQVVLDEESLVLVNGEWLELVNDLIEKIGAPQKQCVGCGEETNNYRGVLPMCVNCEMCETQR